VEVPEDLLRTVPSGLTAEQVAARAAQTSYAAKASDEQLRAAAARVDAAWSQFLPRLTGKAAYTRLSDFTPPSLALAPPGINSLATTQAPGPPGTPFDATKVIVAAPPNFSLPLVLDNWLLQATLVVPISDYFLRISQNYTAATQAQEAARFDALAARAKSASDGKVAFYTWLRARGAAVVAVQALGDQTTHLNDAKNQFAVGNASRADVLRAETAVAAAELQVERAKNLAALTEEQVRVAMHLPAGTDLAAGETVDTPPPAFQGNLSALTQEALGTRLEIKSIDANAVVAREQAKVSRAGAYPQLSAFGDALLANPNQRRFPQTNEWFPTWDVGAQLTWSPNDVLSGSAQGADLEARAAALDAQKMQVRDGIEIEVVQAYQAVREADVGLESTKRELASATEAHRVARELFNNGRGTSTTLTDAETELTRARLDSLNAHVDARIARIRLEHALGRDASWPAVTQAQAGPPAAGSPN
jgi:outer membrane protein TolC